MNLEIPDRQLLASRAPRRGVRGFNRLDALALLGTTLLLGLVWATGIGAARPDSEAAGCLATMRQLVLAQQVYTLDHQDAFPYNSGVAETQAEISQGTFRNWVNDNLDWSAGSSSGNTNVDWALRGGVGPYLQGHVEAFRCPADRYLATAQAKAGWRARIRSRSMNAYLGRFSIQQVNPQESQGHNTFDSGLRQFLRPNEVARPDRTFIFLDEHPDSINDGYFLNTPGNLGSWGDVPASYHHGGGGFGFVDGHGETHRWESKTTRLPVRFSYTAPSFDAAGRADMEWYRAHAPFEVWR